VFCVVKIAFDTPSLDVLSKVESGRFAFVCNQ
jgi:hypothetical protein